MIFSWLSWLAVLIARGRVRTTTRTAAKLMGWQRHAPSVYSVPLWYWTSMLRLIGSCTCLNDYDRAFLYFLVKIYNMFWYEKRKEFPLAIFIHRALAVWKREILRKLGIVGLLRVTGNTLTTKRKWSEKTVGTFSSTVGKSQLIFYQRSLSVNNKIASY